MTVDFRCEKCGKLLSVDDDPGGSVQCPHCGKQVKVPEAPASLPHPQVPPNAQESQSPPPPVGSKQADQEEIPEEPRSDATMTLMANLMPWVLSVFFHLGLALIMAFFIVFSQRTELNVTVPDSVLSIETNAMLEVGDTERHVKDLAKKNDPERNYSTRESSIKADKGKTAKRVRLIGRGASSGTSNLFGGMSTGASAGGPGAGMFGTKGKAFHIVYVIDRSGSMVTVFDEVMMEMQNSISKLRDTQDFHVILFAADKAVENPPRRLVYATARNKLGVVDFLDGDNVIPSGKTTALPALKRAFEVLKHADKRKPGMLIFLLTDGEFGGGGGGSEYKGLSGNEAILQWIKDNNPNGKIHINTFLYGNQPGAVKVMKRIATENGGSFKLISEDE